MQTIHTHEDTVKKFDLLVSDDQMKLFAHIEPREYYRRTTLDELLEEIHKVAPAELVDRRVVNDIWLNLRLGLKCEHRRVAIGKTPNGGKDGKLVWLVRRFSPGQGDNLEREFSDFFTLGLFENIEEGTEIARVYKAGDGENGVDVFGKVIPAEAGKNVDIKWDKSVLVNSDEARPHFASIVAANSGYVHHQANLAGVRDTIALPGNLDGSIGNLDFLGNVTVGGDIQKGFHIKARGNIRVKGAVLGDNKLVSKGSISIAGYHIGSQDSSLSADGDYSVGLAQGVVADVGGDIYIETEARDCTFYSCGGVLATKATIIGGVIWCVRGLEAKTIGNDAGLRTDVGLRTEIEVTPEYRKLSLSIARHEAALAALELHIGPYLKNRARVPLLNKEFRAKMTELLSKYDQVAGSLESLQKKIEEMKQAAPEAQDAFISAREYIHAGVVLTAEETALDLQENVHGPVGYRFEGETHEWKQGDFKSVERK
jgi:uncharacterized protein (DUF342 family)